MMARSNETTQSIRSIPALAAAIRETHSRAWPTSTGKELRHRPFTTFYLIQAKSKTAEARAAAHLVSEVAERMRRLGEAYGEWDPFDPAAYFDLSEFQAEQLIHVEERINTVHIAFFMDPLLPSFYKAEAFWANHFFPAYHAANPGNPTIGSNQLENDSASGNSPEDGVNDSAEKPSPTNGAGSSERAQSLNGKGPQGHHLDSAFSADFATSIFPEMAAHWRQLIDVSQQVRRILADHIGYLAVNGSQEERGKWRSAWMQPSPVMEMYEDLVPDYRTLPTLSLSIEFPLPVYRQPGRQQRLRLNRQRRWSSRK